METDGRCLNDSDSFNDLLLVHLRTRPVEISDDCSHTSFVSHSGGQVDWLFGIVFGEALNLYLILTKIVPINEPS